MARPKKTPEERRDGMLCVRLTAAERAELNESAAQHGTTAADFMRRRSLGIRLPPASPAQQAQARLVVELNRQGVNLNQIARHMNAGRGAPAHLSALLDHIRALLDRFA